MTSIRSFAEAEKILADHVPQQVANTGKHFSLDRMEPLLNAIGNPQDDLRIIHVAGTSGKTSTTYYISALLSSLGKKVGMTVSPHVDSVTERVQINGRPITETEFYTNLDEFMGLTDGVYPSPTYFELLVAFAYWHFVRQQVDYAVVETGLGGLLDATNVADRPDKVCVITDIGLDHTNILGVTIPEIAGHKAGIIHEGNVVLMHKQADEVMDVVRKKCQQKSAELKIASDKLEGINVPAWIPDFQRHNFNLAYSVYEYLMRRDGLPKADAQKAMSVIVPGRMDVVEIGGKTIIMDGAHNEQKMGALVGSFKKQHPGKKVPVLLALKQGKDMSAVLQMLKPVTSELIVTEYEAMQDLPVASTDAAELAAAAREFGYDKITVEPDKDKAYGLLLANPDTLVLVLGSFYLLSQLRHDHNELIQ